MKSVWLKKLAVITLAASLTVISSLAADTDHTDAKHNGVVMKDGKMMVVKDGQVTPMEQDMTMSDGTKVSKDGTVTMKDGKTKTLKDGQMVTMDGKMMKEKKAKKE
jgi:hypothetical protein